MTRALLRRADALRGTEAERHGVAWETFWRRRANLSDPTALREYLSALDALDEVEARGGREAVDVRLAEIEAARVAYLMEREAEAPPPDVAEAWQRWWADVDAVAWAADAGDLGVWPHTLPAPPFEPDDDEWAERARVVADFRTAEPGKDRRAALAFLASTFGWLDAVRESVGRGG